MQKREKAVFCHHQEDAISSNGHPRLTVSLRPVTTGHPGYWWAVKLASPLAPGKTKPGGLALDLPVFPEW